MLKTLYNKKFQSNLCGKKIGSDVMMNKLKSVKTLISQNTSLRFLLV